MGIIDISPNQSSVQTASYRLTNAKTGETISFLENENTNFALTERELEILKLINEGLLSKEISGRLSISIHTVNRHRQNILQKMNVQNLMEAVNLARSHGLLA